MSCIILALKKVLDVKISYKIKLIEKKKIINSKFFTRSYHLVVEKKLTDCNICVYYTLLFEMFPLSRLNRCLL